MNQFQFGFKPIGEMTPDEMIEEIAEMQKEQLLKMNPDQLKSIIVDYRLTMYRHRLVLEAQFSNEESPPQVGWGGY